MTETKKIQGIVPVLVTPVTAEGEVDVPALRRLIDYLCDKDIGGMWVLGTGGEDMNLTYAQRLLVASTVVEANAGRVPLVLGAGFFAHRDIRNFMDDTRDLDVYAYHVMPYHPLLSLERLEWFYKDLADHASRPLWMYTSANWCRFIPPEFVAKLKDYPNIGGIKFSSSNAVHTEQVLSMADDNFQVITAVVRTLYANLCLGASGATTVEASPFPEPIIEIYRRFRDGDLPGALEAQRRLNRFLEDMPAEPGKDNFLKVAEGKYVLSRRGICDIHMTGYYRVVNAGEMAQIDSAIRKHKLIPYD